MKQGFTLFLLAAMLLTFSSCHRHDEGELITVVKVVLYPKGGGPVSTFRWEDNDGPGGNAPGRRDTIRLNDSSEYDVEVLFLNQDVDKTPEIRNEDDEHIVCYSGMPESNLKISYADSDGKYPVGLKTTWKSYTEGSGLLRVNLRHQPRSKDGSCDAGESDVDVTFNIRINR